MKKLNILSTTGVWWFVVVMVGDLFCSHPIVAQVNSQSPDRLWQVLDKQRIAVGVGQLSSLTQIPQAFQTFKLDQSRLTRLLQSSLAALSTNDACSGIQLTLPMPDQTYVRFCVRESPILEPELAVQFPDIKTYEGQGIDDRTMTVRFDRTPTGFHAIVLTPNRTFYIDPFPLRRGDLATHISYFDKDAQLKAFNCLARSDATAKPLTRPIVINNGGTLRTYRLAVAATGEYTKFQGGTINAALAAIVTTVNRVDAIYQRELAISLKLVKDEAKIIYADPATDPYSNDDDGKLLDENQQNLDSIVGPANYDIGHVFGTGGGGLAALGVVGADGRKAQGETGSSSPRGDPFDVDFVAHEMGHQFGANHTFNGTTGSCGGRNRNSGTAFEPGSGSTIMAYAGICLSEDLQPHSDPYFHTASLEEILSYVTDTGVDSVPVKTATNNRPPVVTGGGDFMVPKGTPFSLTAIASDPDGDTVSYCWEELDLGEPAPPNDDASEARPLFRSLNPGVQASRIFPRMETLLAGQSPLGDLLPARNRSMNFRVTARDNHSGGGGFSFSTATVSVITDSGPFKITQPQQTTTWVAGSTQIITWDVAGTSSTPISCSQVKISISTNGGKTFTPLTQGTSNTGSATVVVPNASTTVARIKIEAIGNVFFNVSPEFKITSTN